MLASAGSVPSDRNTAVCQPGERETRTSMSMSPPRSALTFVTVPPTRSPPRNRNGNTGEGPPAADVFSAVLGGVVGAAAGHGLAGQHHPAEDPDPLRGAVALVGNGFGFKLPPPGKFQPRGVDRVGEPVGQAENVCYLTRKIPVTPCPCLHSATGPGPAGRCLPLLPDPAGARRCHHASQPSPSSHRKVSAFRTALPPPSLLK